MNSTTLNLRHTLSTVEMLEVISTANMREASKRFTDMKRPVVMWTAKPKLTRQQTLIVDQLPQRGWQLRGAVTNDAGQSAIVYFHAVTDVWGVVYPGGDMTRTQRRLDIRVPSKWQRATEVAVSGSDQMLFIPQAREMCPAGMISSSKFWDNLQLHAPADAR